MLFNMLTAIKGPPGTASKCAGHTAQSELPKPGTGTASKNFSRNQQHKSHSLPSGTAKTDITLPTGMIVRASMCQCGFLSLAQ
jgi:hypothetical protein